MENGWNRRRRAKGPLGDRSAASLFGRCNFCNRICGQNHCTTRIEDMPGGWVVIQDLRRRVNTGRKKAGVKKLQETHRHRKNIGSPIIWPSWISLQILWIYRMVKGVELGFRQKSEISGAWRIGAALQYLAGLQMLAYLAYLPPQRAFRTAGYIPYAETPVADPAEGSHEAAIDLEGRDCHQQRVVDRY